LIENSGERALRNKPSLPLSLLVMVSEMFSCDCFWWNSVPESYPSEPEPFSLPAPLPQWPQGVCFCVSLVAVLFFFLFISKNVISWTKTVAFLVA